MIERIKKLGLVSVITSLALVFCIAPVSYGQEIPPPGTVINASNIDKWKHMFPKDFLPIFTDGWGVIDPISITTIAPTKVKRLKAEVAASKSNIGKFTVDSEGWIPEDISHMVGLPFEGVTPEDQNFALKYYWNKNYRYTYDSQILAPTGIYGTQFSKRRGESQIGIDLISGYDMKFTGRMYQDPKPYIPTKQGLKSAGMMIIQYPSIMRNLFSLSWRHMDEKKDDISFAYVPSLRRVLRGESGERSTPINNSTQAPDDFNIFAGRVGEFDFKYLGETTLLCVLDANMPTRDLDASLKYAQEEGVPWPLDRWEPRKMYIIDVIAKDANYPQSHKVTYCEPNYPLMHYGFAYDRAGELWKVWMSLKTDYVMYPTGERYSSQQCQFGLDIQMGYMTQFPGPDQPIEDVAVNKGNFTESDFQPSVIRRLAR